jgi:hypothetical protein
MKRIRNRLFIGTVFVSLVIALIASPILALPPDPDNAALLYYQSFLTLAELSEEAQNHIRDVARGDAAPDDKVREDISKCIGAIQFAEAACRVPSCNWGVRFSQGFDALFPQLAQAKFLTFVLVADARIQAADENYKGALERCLMTGTFARHVGDDTFISYLVSLAVRDLGYKCMQDIVGKAGSDVEVLRWFRTELATYPVGVLSPVKPLKIELEIVTDLMRMENIVKLARILAESDDKKTAEIIKMANENLLKQNRRAYSERMKAGLIVLSTPTPYEKAHSKLNQLANDFDPNDRSSVIAGTFMPALARILTLKTRTETHSNAIKVAIEVLLRRAKTKRLPDALPDGLPGDLFSGKDFEYEINNTGFVLRCRSKDLDKNEIYEYEFKVKK